MGMTIDLVEKEIKRLDVWIADLGDVVGSEQGGIRPITVLQNDKGNKYAPTVTIAPITSSKTKRRLPTHVYLSANEVGLESDSTILVEQVKTIDKSRLQFKVAEIPNHMAWMIDRAYMIQGGITFS